jgi:hypothetical protein
MHRPRSTSSKSRQLLAAALTIVGCGCAGQRKELDLVIIAPGGAILSIDHDGEASQAALRGVASHRGEMPCRLAIYSHETEPDPSDAPTLVGDAAPPATIGEDGKLVFETILPPPLDGRVRTRELGLLHIDEDNEDDSLHIWLTIATCEQPNIDITPIITAEICGTTAEPHARLQLERVET